MNEKKGCVLKLLDLSYFILFLKNVKGSKKLPNDLNAKAKLDLSY